MLRHQIDEVSDLLETLFERHVQSHEAVSDVHDRHHFDGHFELEQHVGEVERKVVHRVRFAAVDARRRVPSEHLWRGENRGDEGVLRAVNLLVDVGPKTELEEPEVENDVRVRLDDARHEELARHCDC